MPTSIVGSPTGVASPSLQPDPDTVPSLAAPQDIVDGVNAVTVDQPFSALANEIAYLKRPTAGIPGTPTGLDAKFKQPISARRNVQGQRRDFSDHRAYDDLAHVTRWHEFWDNVGMVPKTTGNGPWAGRWNYSINIGGGAPQIQRGTWVGLPSPPSYPGGTLTLDSGNVISGNAICLVEADSMSGLTLNDDSDIVFQVECSGGGGTGCETFWGLTQQSQIGSTALFTASNPVALGFIVRSGDTNYHLYYFNGIASPTVVDLGVSVGTRFRLEYQGVNASDDGTARILAYVGGAVLKNIAIDFTPVLPATPTLCWPLLRMTSLGSRKTSWFGAMDFAGARWPGDIAY